jgi:GNAT superfamily N-acetyltransferase
MIRPTLAEDDLALLSLTQATGVFSAPDLEVLREVLADYHAANWARGHQSVTLEEDGRVLGFAYYAPAPMTDRTWYLWWIVVDKHVQATGLGRRLLQHVEKAIRKQNGRLLLLETSSLPSYELTRRFYLKNGYEVAAVLKDYYAVGHDMVVFRKGLTG